MTWAMAGGYGPAPVTGPTDFEFSSSASFTVEAISCVPLGKRCDRPELAACLGRHSNGVASQRSWISVRPSRRFVLFVLVGAAAGALNIVARAAIDLFVSFELAVAIAFPIATTFAFILNRKLVFESGGLAWHVEYLRFLLVNVFALVQVWVVSVLLVRVVFPQLGFTWHAATIGHAIGVGSPILTSYFAHQHFSFGRPRQAKGDQDGTPSRDVDRTDLQQADAHRQ